jgi:hypothetical protein
VDGMPKPLENVSLDGLSKVALDALYVSVGLGVIAFQKAQVRRVELQKTLEDQVKELETRFRHIVPGNGR